MGILDFLRAPLKSIAPPKDNSFGGLLNAPAITIPQAKPVAVPVAPPLEVKSKTAKVTPVDLLSKPLASVIPLQKSPKASQKAPSSAVDTSPLAFLKSSVMSVSPLSPTLPDIPRIVRNQDWKDVANLPSAVAGFTLGPAIDAILSLRQAISGKEEHGNIPNIFKDEKHGGANAYESKTSQRFYIDQLDAGVPEKQAFWNTALKTVGDMAVLVPIVQDISKFTLLRTAPERLIDSEVTTATRQQIRDFASGADTYKTGKSPLPPEIQDAFKAASNEEKARMVKGSGIDIATAKPSFLGRLVGISEEEASALIEQMGGKVRKTPAGKLPGYARDEMAPAMGMSTERRVPVGFGDKPIDVSKLENQLARVKESLFAAETNPEAHLKAYGEDKRPIYKEKIKGLEERIATAKPSEQLPEPKTPPLKEADIETALEEMTQSDKISVSKAIEIKRALRSPDIAEKEAAQLEMQKLEAEFATRALEDNNARKLSKFEAKKGDMQGKLPEVTGKGKSKFAQKGDEISEELGFKTSEEARDAYEKFKVEKAKLAEINKSVSEKVKNIRDRKAILEALRKEVSAEARSRIQTIRAIQTFFHLTDTEIGKLMGMQGLKSVQLMTDGQFKGFIKGLEGKAAENFQLEQARGKLKATIFEKELLKTDNLRKALKLPEIQNMSLSQLKSLDTILSGFEQGDEFLGPRQLETVRHTNIKDIRTIREARAKLAAEAGVDASALDTIKVDEFDRMRYDTALARRNPLYRVMVEEKNRALLDANMKQHLLSERVNELVKKARKATRKPIYTKQGILERLAPTDQKIFDWLSSPDASKVMFRDNLTPEELETAAFMREWYKKARDYLVEREVLKKFRENYITHIQRGFFEAWKDDGFVAAFKAAQDHFKQEAAVFNILDQKTSEVLPLEKFFQFSMQRFDQIVPTKNVAKAFLAYSGAFYKKQALDSLIPKLDIYVHSLSPKKLTPRGLEFDDSLKRFWREWMNTKKGRVVDFAGVKPGGKIDIGLKAGVAFTRILDLGLSVPTGLASNVGEQVMNLVTLGPKAYAKGAARLMTKQGRAITKKYSNFVGETFWQKMTDTSKDIGDKLGEGLFGLFSAANRRGNQTYLLGSMTAEEFKAGEISSERLAKLQTAMGKLRAIEGSSSIIGSTSVASVGKQYRSWAIPIISGITNDIAVLRKALKSEGVDALKRPETAELLRAIIVTTVIAVTGYSYFKRENSKKASDRSFLEQLIFKASGDALSIVGALDPSFWTSTPRLLGFLHDISTALKQIVLLDQAKNGSLSGPKNLLKAVTPAALKQVTNMKDDPNAELKGMISEKSAKGADLLKKAEDLDAELQKMTPAEANAKAKSVKESDPALYTKLKTAIENRTLALTEEQKLIKQLTIKDGARARYIYDQLEKLTNKDEKNALYKELRTKKVITDAVAEQLKEYVASNAPTSSIPSGTKVKDDSVLSKVVTYAKAFGVDPVTAFNRIFTGQKIKRVTNGTVFVERMSLTDSEKEAQDQLTATTTKNLKRSDVKLDHTIPLELGGSNSKDNLRLVTTAEWASYSPIENFLGDALDEGRISKSTAQDLIRKFKRGDITAEQVRNSVGK
jgi:predicted RNA-binding protein YlxR (DUF448 family)